MEILKKPLVTEKYSGEEGANCFGFVVDKRANKLEIKNAIEKMYNVSVVNINTMVYAGKKRSRYTKSGLLLGKTAAFKKAIVKLAEGETIDFYSNI